MGRWSHRQGWGGVAILPFVLAWACLVRAYVAPPISGALVLGMIVGVAGGLMFLPRMTRTARIATLVLYVPVVLGALPYVALWFAGFFFGDSL
jgi:hypothetical protein